MRELASLEQENKKFVTELEKYKELDPDAFEKNSKYFTFLVYFLLVEKDLSVCKEGANRWTDNIFSLQSFCANKFNIARNDFGSQFGIPEEFDYVE